MNIQRPRTRLQRRDYGSFGVHFVTICCQDRKEYFGSISSDQKMNLSTIGEFAENRWKVLGEFYPYVRIREYIFMPDHMHGIIEILPNWIEQDDLTPNEFGPLKDGLPKVIRGYKAHIKSEMNRQGKFFQWQRSYYVETIYSEARLNQVKEYIALNPSRWVPPNHE